MPKRLPDLERHLTFSLRRTRHASLREIGDRTSGKVRADRAPPLVLEGRRPVSCWRFEVEVARRRRRARSPPNGQQPSSCIATTQLTHALVAVIIETEYRSDGQAHRADGPPLFRSGGCVYLATPECEAREASAASPISGSPDGCRLHGCASRPTRRRPRSCCRTANPREKRTLDMAGILPSGMNAYQSPLSLARCSRRSRSPG